MRLVTFTFRGAERLGVEEGDHVVDINRAAVRLLREEGHPRPEAYAAATVPPNAVAFLEAGEDALAAARRALAACRERWDGAELRAEGVVFDRDAVRLRAPLLNPRKILCVGLNYRDHAQELGWEVPKEPALFAKFANSIVGPGEPIVLPEESEQVDYEAELGIVIGRRCRRVERERALDVVAGYVALNDVSARDYQMRTTQWTAGKIWDTFLPMGPALVLADEIPDPDRLEIRCEIGSEVLQRSNTSNFIFDVREMVSYLSTILTLEPGDVIATGTPSGVGYRRNPPRYLRPGEVVRVSIEGIGTLENPVVR